MKVLITGATGLIGKAITSECIAKGYSVNFLTTRAEGLAAIEGAKGYLWNPRNLEMDQNALLGVDAIVNLAGYSISKPWTRKNKNTILNSRLNSVETLYQGIVKTENSSVKHFVSASAIGIYSHSFSDKRKESSGELADDFLGKVVEQWEGEISKISNLNIKTSILRLGLVLSTQDGILSGFLQPMKKRIAVFFGTGEQWQSWIHIEDVAAMFIYAIENELTEVYNAVAPNPVRQREFVQSIAKLLDKKIIFIRLPKPLVKLLFGERSTLLLSSQCVSVSKLKKTGYQFKYPTLLKALEHLLK